MHRGSVTVRVEHALTQGFVWTSVVFYLVVDAIFGITASLAGSILPGIVVHAVGLAVFFAIVWPGDPTRQAVADGGADPTFWLHAVQAVAFGLLAFVAFRRLEALTEGHRASPRFDEHRAS